MQISAMGGAVLDDEVPAAGEAAMQRGSRVWTELLIALHNGQLPPAVVGILAAGLIALCVGQTRPTMQMLVLSERDNL